MDTLPVAGRLVVPAVFTLWMTPLAAQGPGLPTYHRFTTRGLAMALDYGRAGLNLPNDFHAWGVTGTFAFGSISMDTSNLRLYNVGVSASQTAIGGGPRTTVLGVQAGLVMDYIHVGWMRWDSAGVGRWRAPISYGAPFIWCTYPSYAIRLWGGARLDVDHRGASSGGSGARTIARPGFVLGVHFQLANGLGVQAAGDNTRLSRKNAWIFGVGVHYARHSFSHSSALAPDERCGFFMTPS